MLICQSSGLPIQILSMSSRIFVFFLIKWDHASRSSSCRSTPVGRSDRAGTSGWSLTRPRGFLGI